MNLLFSSWYSGLGGGETDLLTLMAALPRTTWQCHLLLAREGVLAERWRALGGTVHIVPFRGATTLFHPGLWAHLPAVGRFRRLLTEQQIDLIHADYHSLPFMAAAARQTGTPLVWTVHGWWFQPQRWQQAFFRALPTVARSRSIRDGFLGNPPFRPPTSVPVVYSGVDTERFAPATEQPLRRHLNIAADVPLVAMVARFQSVKGHATFQAMARRIVAQQPNVQLVVAGEDVFGVAADQRLRDETLHTAQHDPLLRERLHYIGFRDDVERVYQAADVVVCASDFESYGKANLEAMACGVPVVSTRAGGPAETVVEGETGYLVPPKDDAAFAARVLSLLADPARRLQMGQAARAHVQRHFSVAAMVAGYEQAFNDARLR